jgi:hypothetical protein
VSAEESVSFLRDEASVSCVLKVTAALSLLLLSSLMLVFVDRLSFSEPPMSTPVSSCSFTNVASSAGLQAKNEMPINSTREALRRILAADLIIFFKFNFIEYSLSLNTDFSLY